MNKSFDTLPLLLFFGSYYFYGFFLATQVFVASTALTLVISYIKKPMPLKSYSSSLLVIGLGGLTIITKNELFLVWKPTVMYIITSLSLLISQLYFQKSLLEKGINAMGLHAPDYPWRRLDTALSLLFALLAFLNLQVFYYFGLDTWVKYKFYSLFAMMLLFIPIMIHIDSNAVRHEPS